jgi:hypothetical protein
LRKKIIGVSVLFMALAMICAQAVAAQPMVTVDAKTDKPWYNPGDTGVLQISVLNTLNNPFSIINISITYPWKAYDANTGNWIGNETIRLAPSVAVHEKGGSYYTTADFTVPNDGGARGGDIGITVGTTNGTYPTSAYIQVVGTTTIGVMPIEMLGLSTWMTSLGVIIVVCTIILAAVIIVATRGARVPRMIASPVPKVKS